MHDEKGYVESPSGKLKPELASETCKTSGTSQLGLEFSHSFDVVIDVYCQAVVSFNEQSRIFWLMVIRYYYIRTPLMTSSIYMGI